MRGGLTQAEATTECLDWLRQPPAEGGLLRQQLLADHQTPGSGPPSLALTHPFAAPVDTVRRASPHQESPS
jgi:hypothetical protein